MAHVARYQCAAHGGCASSVGAGTGRHAGDRTARRGVVGALLVLAVLGAAGLMASSLVDGPGLRVALQVSGSITAVVFGSVASVLAWRWWGGRADR